MSAKNIWVRAIEVFLLEVVVFLSLWLINDLVAGIFTLIIPVLCGSILIIAGIAELLERSKISKLYFIVMGISVITPVLVAAAYFYIMGKPFSLNI